MRKIILEEEMVSREIGHSASLTPTVTRKGQVTIPAPLRKEYGIRQGMKIQVTDTPNSHIETVVDICT